MTYLSVCSGIEAATVAWHPLEWTPIAFSEIELFPCAVLSRHYPDVPNLGDMTRYKEWIFERSVDLLVGGTPCQSFSVAGLRAGLDDPCGNLMLVYLGLVRRFAPRWVVWENVLGVLSSHQGRDFGTFLGGLAECGYGFAYRVLDAQFVRVESHPRAVPQRRRRVFVVGHLGDWRAAAAVLFEPESLRGYPPPRREAGTRVAPTASGGVGRNGGNDFNTSGGLVAVSLTSSFAKHGGASGGEDSYPHNMITQALTGRFGSGGPDDNKAQGGSGRSDGESEALITHALRADGFDASEDGTGRGTPLVFTERTREAGRTFESQNGVSYALTNPGSGGRTHSRQLWDGACVRRLTPTECERLQGFPDDYTAITHRGKPAADGPRYRALGNSMAVNVMRWIGERIAMVDDAAQAIRGGRRVTG